MSTHYSRSPKDDHQEDESDPSIRNPCHNLDLNAFLPHRIRAGSSNVDQWAPEIVVVDLDGATTKTPASAGPAEGEGGMSQGIPDQDKAGGSSGTGLPPSGEGPGMEQGKAEVCKYCHFSSVILAPKQGTALSAFYQKLSFASRSALAGFLSTGISFYWKWSHNRTWFSIAQAIGSQRKSLVGYC